MKLAPGATCNWAKPDDIEYIKHTKQTLYKQLHRQRLRLYRGLSPYEVGHFPEQEEDLIDWNQRNPNFAISIDSFSYILRRARENAKRFIEN